jgi:hypothetical protein
MWKEDEVTRPSVTHSNAFDVVRGAGHTLDPTGIKQTYEAFHS